MLEHSNSQELILSTSNLNPRASFNSSVYQDQNPPKYSRINRENNTSSDKQDDLNPPAYTLNEPFRQNEATL